MDEQLDYIELVKKAQLDDKQSLNRLAELAGYRLSTYVYRLTLQHDLTQEIVQESMLEMCKILGKLKKPDRFWPWLYSIAINKIHRHHRTERTQRKLAYSKAKQFTLKQREQDLQDLVGQELKQIIAASMQNLKTRHRAVLVMRCYDEMSYAEIADSMGCSEFSTRMLFLRAKKALQKQLSRNGFGRGSLLAALILFGKMTAPTEAAAANVSVAATSTGVGLAAGLVGLVTSKTAVVSFTTAAVLTAGSVVVTSGLKSTTRRADQVPAGISSTFSPPGQTQNHSEQYWYYFPEGVGKPMMMRVKDGAGSNSHSQFLQNDRANYQFNDNTIHINNHRMYAGDLTVMRLPTDSPQLSGFLDQLEKGREEQKMQYVPNTGRGLLVIATRSSARGPNRPWVIRHDNVLDEDYFQADWPTGAATIDNRDTMHKRGWTYFTVTGSINGQTCSGTGRIPFVYAAGKRYSPWLKLRLGQQLMVADTGENAYIIGPDRKVLTRFKPGSFFKGLPRPWMGLHTIDTIRRDAAEQHIGFTTKRSAGNKVQVELTCKQVQLIYSVDLELDVVDKLTFSTDNNTIGELNFSYLQNIDNAGSRFVSPLRISSRAPQQPDTGLLWLARLADGSLAK